MLVAASTATGPTKLPVRSSSSPPISTECTPGRRRAVAAFSSELVAMSRSRASTSEMSALDVVEASNAAAPSSGTRSIAFFARIAFAPARAVARAPNGSGSSGATAPPRTRRTTPSASRSARSRRTVIAETRSSSAADSRRIAPSCASSSRSRARRSLASSGVDMRISVRGGRELGGIRHLTACRAVP